MDDMKLEVNLGFVKSWGQLDFRFVLHSSGVGHLAIYAHDPRDMRKSGILLSLNEAQYDRLKAIIAKTDETIAELRKSGKMTEMRNLA